MNDNLLIKASSLQLKYYDKDGTVIFVANAFGNEDSARDVSLKGSFAKTIKEGFGRVRYLFAHDQQRKIGEPLEAWESDDGLIIKAVLNLNKDDGRNVYEDYKLAAEYGKSVEHSVGVIPIKSRGKDPRYVTEWKLVEVSYIPMWGANPATPMIALKDEEFAKYCVANGNYTDCYIKKLEPVVTPLDKEPFSDTLLQLKSIIEPPQTALDSFYKKLKL